MTQRDYEALALFRYNLRKFFRFSEQAAAKGGLSIRQYQALLTIRGFPDGKDCTVGDIAEWLQIRHHSAVGLINRLEKDKLVSKHRGKADKRQVCIRLTARGTKTLERVAALNKQELKRLRPQLALAKLLKEPGR